MIIVPFENIEEAIAKAFENVDEKIYLDKPTTLFLNKVGEYLSIYGCFVEKYHLPDYPCFFASNHWPELLKLSREFCAVWDFDYYQLSLSLENENIVIIHHTKYAINFIKDKTE